MLGCKEEAVEVTERPYPQGELERIVLGSNIIYVGGGNTLQMMKVWRKFNMHQILEKAERKGIVLSGLSAGGICWFKFGNSDSLKSANKNAKTIKVSGLNLVPGLFCPHYNVEKFRKQELKEMLRGTKLKSIALDNCTAIHIKGSEFKILKSKRDAKAYLAYWRNNKYFQDELIAKKFSPIFW